MNPEIPGRRIPLIAFSLANLTLVNVWRDLVSSSYFFYWKKFPGYAPGEALAFWLLLLTSIFWASYYLVRRAQIPWLTTAARLFFLAVSVRAFNQLRAQIDSLSTSNLRLIVGRAGYAGLVAILLGVLALAICIYGLPRATFACAMILLAFSPLGLVYSAQAALVKMEYDHAIATQHPGANLNSYSLKKPRLVWIIFDEMDEGVAFDRRPATLRLPQFDRLWAESLSGQHASPPAGHTTVSIPSLLTGSLLSDSHPEDPTTFLLSTSDNTKVFDWKNSPDIFSAVQNAGINTALVGWAIPYCRIVGARLNSCYWHPAGQMADPAKVSFSRNVSAAGLKLFDLVPLVGRNLTRMFENYGADEYRSQHRQEYADLVSHAERVVTNPQFGCIFIHLPVPHPPYIGGSDGTASYLDNLALADDAFGRLRHQMEDAGLWNRTTVIVSADHWWRWEYWRTKPFWNPADTALESAPPDHRVPFIVKFANQTRAVTYKPSFNTVLTHDMVLDILQGTIADADQASMWLDAHRTAGP